MVLPVLLVIWWVIATSGASQTLFPSPREVLDVLLHPFTDLLSSGSMAWSIYVSISRIVLGFLIAALIGVPVGFAMGYSRAFRSFLSLMVEMARPLSAIALLPLSLIIFKGLTLSGLLGLTHLRYERHLLNEMQLGMLFILFWGGVFPIILGTMQGVRGVRKLHLETARILGARRLFTFKHVILPAALPDVYHGLRLAVGRCWMVIIAAEMLPGTNSGLGYLLRYSYQLSRYDVMLACIIVIAVIGATFAKSLESLGEGSLVLRSKER